MKKVLIGLAVIVVLFGLVAFATRPGLLSPGSTSTNQSQAMITVLPDAVDGFSDNDPKIVPTAVLGADPGQQMVPISTEDPHTTCLSDGNSAYEDRMLELVNQARADAGLQPLSADARLQNAARMHNLDMICNHYVSHTGSDGSSPQGRMTAQGYAWTYYGENIYAGPPYTPDAAFNAMMNSAHHRANILSPKFTDLGVSYEYQDGSNYGGYFTLDFGKE